MAPWMISKEMTGLNLSVSRAHISEEEMGWTQHKHSEKHLVLLRARQATDRFHTTPTSHALRAPHREILAPGEGWASAGGPQEGSSSTWQQEPVFEPI